MAELVAMLPGRRAEGAAASRTGASRDGGLPADGGGPRERVLLGIAGVPGAGKTTVAEAVCAALGATAVHVPMDGFHLSDAVLDAEGTRDVKGAPQTFDARGYAALLDRVRADRDHVVYGPGFDRGLEQPIAASVAVRPEHEVVVSEGNYLLLDDGPWAGLRTRFDEVWYVVTADELRTDRIVRRHVTFGKSPEAARAWVERVEGPNARLVAATADRADRLLDVTHLQI